MYDLLLKVVADIVNVYKKKLAIYHELVQTIQNYIKSFINKNDKIFLYSNKSSYNQISDL